ncbi:MAG: hypothetical protein OEV66_02690 [Spirochaetia bacterium]|nr:hypothetical protein [Spirochaetia bacterium]
MFFKKPVIKIILLLCFVFFTSEIFSQFILPEDTYTTHKDMEVIRVETLGVDVRSIKAKTENATKGEVLLTWMPINTKDQLAIVRSDQPISRLSQLIGGRVLSLVDAGNNSYKDTVSSPGDYYYAVVSYTGLKKETVVLKADDNFTTRAVHFDEKDFFSPQTTFSEAVTNIQAEVIDNKSVRIRWNYEPVPNASILIYRSTREIKDEKFFKNALRIGSVPSINNYYDDQDGASGNFFYAAMVLNPFGIEKVSLKPGQTYTIKPINKPEVLSSTVRSIHAEYKSKKNIFVSWSDPNPEFTDKFIVYRSFDQILLEQDLQSALIVGTVDHTFTSYLDMNIPNGDWYYAVLSQNRQGTIQKLLIPGENSMNKPVPAFKEEVKPKPEEEKKHQKTEESNPDLNYDLRAVSEENVILISWKPLQSGANSVDESYFHIFRFTKKPEFLTDLSTENYVAKIPLKKESFIDTPDKDGLYYYALFLDTPKGVMPLTLKLGDNLIGPVIFKKAMLDNDGQNKKTHENPDFSEFDDISLISDQKVNGILRRTYLQQNYTDTLLELKDYKKSSSVKIRAKANFYSALSNYYLKQYETALDQIMDSSVKKIYKDRADFWYRQILEKMTK